MLGERRKKRERRIRVEGLSGVRGWRVRRIILVNGMRVRGEDSGS